MSELTFPESVPIQLTYILYMQKFSQSSNFRGILQSV